MRFDAFTGTSSDRGEAIAQVAWYEGLQLLPQHFQAWDARLDALLQRQMLASNPYAWGIDRFEIDDRALSAGTLRVLSVAGCFADGLAFAWNSQRDGVLECALDTRAQVTRYALAVPIEDFTDNGISVTRFRQIVGAPLADRGNRDEKVPIVRWQPDLMIQSWDALNARYAQLPLIEVIKTATGFEAVGFHPPSTSLARDSQCARDVASVIRLLRAKAALIEARPVPPLLNADYRCGLGWILSSLVSGLPRLEAQMGVSAHPYEICLSLCAIAGMVAPLAGKTPDYFPAYDHENPQALISALVNFIRSIVDGVGVDESRWREIPFTFASGDWEIEIPQENREAELVIQVVFDRTTPESAVVFWLQHALICLTPDKERNRTSRVRGLPRQSYLAMPERGLDAQADRRYVHISLGPLADHAPRRLVIAGPDQHSGWSLAAISLLKWSED